VIRTNIAITGLVFAMSHFKCVTFLGCNLIFILLNLSKTCANSSACFSAVCENTIVSNTKTQLSFPISLANPTLKGRSNVAGLFHVPK
jgi:hypothetical protein